MPKLLLRVLWLGRFVSFGQSKLIHLNWEGLLGLFFMSEKGVTLIYLLSYLLLTSKIVPFGVLLIARSWVSANRLFTFCKSFCYQFFFFYQKIKNNDCLN